MNPIGRKHKHYFAESRDLGMMKMAYSNHDSASTTSSTQVTSLEDSNHGGNFGRQFDTMCDRSFRAPRRPIRRRSESSKNFNPQGIEGIQEEANCGMNINRESKDGEEGQINNIRHIPCSTTQGMSFSAPCSSVYCSENTVSGTPLSVLTKDTVRAFLHDYYADYDALKEPQTLDSIRCFGEKYYRSDFQFVRPSGNPIDREGIIMGLFEDLKVLSYELVSIDSISLISSGKAAVVVYTCEHIFEYKGILAEDRGVMTGVLELTGGEVKIVHEHRSSGKPLPKETRWQSEG